MIKVLIADYDPAARSRLRKCLSDKRDFEVVGECPDGLRALDLIELLNPDAVFIDAELPKISGFEVVRSARPVKRPYTVIVASSDRHAMQAFEANVTDYVLKPVEYERIGITLGRLRRCYERDTHYDGKVDIRDLLAQLQSGVSKSSSAQGSGRVPIKLGRRHRFINTSAIRSIIARNHCVELYMSTGEVLHASDRISDMEKKLPSESFLRVNRSAIVNIGHVQEVLSEKNGYRIVMSDKVKFSAGSTYKSKVRKALMSGQRHGQVAELSQPSVEELMKG